MKNTSALLNLLLAAIIVVLVIQITKTDKNIVEESAPAFVHVPTYESEQPVQSSEKVSVGARGWIMPKPALVIGSYGADGQPNIMTAAWVGIVNSHPISVGISLRPATLSYSNIMETGSFTINVPSAKYMAHMDYVGNISGRDENKFVSLGLTPVKGDYVNAPYIQEFPIVIECEVTQTINLGSHVQFIGKVIDTRIDSHLLKEDGSVDVEKMQPILYEGNAYYGFGPLLGKQSDAFKVFMDDMEPEFKPRAASFNHTLATIYNRKSVRNFTNQQVTKSQLTELVRSGMAAPTAVDKRPWAFVAIDDRQTLDKLAEVLPYARMLKQATSAIMVGGDLDKALSGIEQAYWVQDCSAATQNILLAAESMGLGAVWTGVHPVKDREETVKQILGLPDNIVPLNVIAIGYPTGIDTPKDKWDESILHWNRW
ncbi:flavin reductase [Natronoflexus pectinivorans]|uniref:Flavin reductase (DIM6/NTAB) family NADH-FMN oxidoreductase RutF n=1 Tax=Natronoflexus pectinivorans TaxID=682526 RepID=A0A4V2RVB2_9BACT|nr:flavin reductase [Natronoflexus pectinivorans]TCO03624.1 flavin reductase (DIM6/NTAB) family NADH-FMN oxidoreductase RutF [Natronoflexus pectinivorans]